MRPMARKFADQMRDSHGFEAIIGEFPKETETADGAAATVDCDATQIVKSIVVRVGGETVVILTNGVSRIDGASLSSEFDTEQGSVRSANPSEVKVATGWSIGGIPPTCHVTDCPVLTGPTFESFDRIWAATRTPEAVFQLVPDDLRTLSAPRSVDVFK